MFDVSMADERRQLVATALAVGVAAMLVEVVIADRARAHAGWGWVALSAVVIAGGASGRSWRTALVVPAAFTLGLMASDVWLGARGSRPVGWDLFDNDPLAHTALWLSIMFFSVSQIALIGIAMRHGGGELLLIARDSDPAERPGVQRVGSTTDRLPALPASDGDSSERPLRDRIQELERHRRQLEDSVDELRRYRDRLVIQRAVSQIGIVSIGAAIFAVGVICGMLLLLWARTF